MIAGDNVYGLDFPPAQYDQDWSSILNVSTLTFVDGTPSVAVNVTAPSSGRAFVAIGCGVRNNASTSDRVNVSFEVREDSSEGPVFLAADANRGVQSPGVGNEAYGYSGTFSLVEGMSPGRSYYFVVRHRVTGGNTCDISARNILAIPVP